MHFPAEPLFLMSSYNLHNLPVEWYQKRRYALSYIYPEVTMNKTILTMSALFLLSAGTVFAANETPNPAPQQNGCSCACTMKADGQGQAGHMHGQQPPADMKTSQEGKAARPQHVH